MYTDPTVVRRKVERELADYFARQDHFRSRGIWALEYKFPELLFAFVAPKVKPFPIAPYAVQFEVSNYDVEPPSVRFVNPFTKVPLKRSEIHTNLSRLRAGNGGQQQAPNGIQGAQVGAARQDDLLQAWSPDDDHPFVCLQGVREYHDNPAHTGDPWWLYRGKGAGSLLRLLDLLARYGTDAMRQVNMQLRYEATGIQSELILEQP